MCSNLFDSIKIYEESFENPDDMNHEDNDFDEEVELNFGLKDLAKHYHIRNIYKQSKVLFCFYESTLHLKSFYEMCLTNQSIQTLIYQGKLVFPSLEIIDKPRFNILFFNNNILQIKMCISVPENLDKVEYKCSIIQSIIGWNNMGYESKYDSNKFLNHEDVIGEIFRVCSILYNINIIESL